MDPWVILPMERERHSQQFLSCGPTDGFITGTQAKGFFMQAGLPPMVLAQIWGLADMNGDGKMDINEFSIACKLINLKLKGMELPKSLPPQMLGQAPPTNLPGVMPMGNMGMGMPGMGGPMGMPGQMGQMGQMGMMPGQMGMMGGQMPGQMGMMGGMGMPGQMGMMPGQMGGMQGMPGQMGMGMGGMGGMGGMQQPGMMGGMMPGQGMGVMGGMSQPQQVQAPPASVAVAGVQPSVVPPAQEKVDIMDIPWAIPLKSRAGYMAQFQANDKAKTGQLAAVQAKNLLLGTGLAQQTLAGVWNLADIDKDGKLNTEEFCVAMHLCEQFQKGEPLPPQLPVSLIPPQMRRAAKDAGLIGTPGSGMNSGLGSPASFEDKRKANWEKGQEELSKRRASLLEQQQQEKAERERKEKEAAEAREKQKREAEAKRAAEVEARRARERELQRAQEEQKRRAEEQKEAARKEMEATRLREWEKSRQAELEAHRQRETEKVIALRAKKETLSSDVEAIKTKVEDLTKGIADTRSGVTDVKSFIDGMRSARDQKMADLNALKSQLKEQNQRLLQVTQEKARLEAKNKINQMKEEDGVVVELTDFDLKKQEKLKQVEAIREELATLKVEENEKKERVEENKKVLMEHREKLQAIIATCKALHEGFDEKRREVRAEKQKKIRELTCPDHAWGASPEKSPSPDPFDSPSFDKPVEEQQAAFDRQDTFGGQDAFAQQDSFGGQDAFAKQDSFAGQDAFAKQESFAKQDSFGQEDAFAKQDSFTKQDTLTKEDSFSRQDSVSSTTAGEAREAVAASSDLTGYVQYRALYDYEARNPDELAFKVNDIIMVHPSQDHEPGWLGGELAGKVGWFPEAFAERVLEGGDQTLQPIAEVPENGSDSSSFHDASAAPAADGNGFQANFSETPAPASSTGEQLNEACVSIYPYASDEPGDLTFEAGEYITVTAKAGDWWTGTLNGRTGVFPFNYVEAAPAQGSDSAQPAAPTGENGAEAKDGKKLELAQVIAPYEATSKEQLSLVQGTMIVIKKKTETGWWQGEQGKGKKRSVGWFPASYVKLLESRKEEDSAAGPAQAVASGGERYVAMFPYTGQYEDELSFEEGATILVTGKDEEAWWKGECNGKTGVFPSNYVEPAKLDVPEEEKKREKLIGELFQTEETYLDNLKLVYEVFIRPIRAANVLSKQELSILFINWKDLIITNTKLMKSMRIRRGTVQSQSMIGDILCENFPAMTAYIRFCSSQLSAAALLQKLVETRHEFDLLLRQCQAHQRVQGMPLSFYLLKPVKRVTEYPLLVEKLAKSTPPEHPDYTCLMEALQRARTLCEQVNEGMRMKENSERLEWLQIHVDLQTEEKALQEKITFNSLTNSVGPRRFLHCGVLKKTKSEKELVGFLFNDFLLLTTASKSFDGSQFSFDKHHSSNLKLYRQPIFLNTMTVGSSLRSEDDEVGFSLRLGPESVLGLDALSVNDRTLWTSKINEACSNFEETEKKFLTRQKSVEETETKESKGRLLLIVVKGEHIKEDGGTVHAYCEASIGSQEQKTAVVTGCNPHWNASMQFLVKDLQQDILCLTVFDRDFFSPNEFLGRSELRVADIVAGCEERRGPVTKTLKLLEAESGVLSVKVDIQLFQ